MLCLEEREAALKELNFLEISEESNEGKIMSNKQVNKSLLFIDSKLWLFSSESEVKHFTGFIYLNLNKTRWLNILNICWSFWGKIDYLAKMLYDIAVGKENLLLLVLWVFRQKKKNLGRIFDSFRFQETEEHLLAWTWCHVVISLGCGQNKLCACQGHSLVICLQKVIQTYVVSIQYSLLITFHASILPERHSLS